MNKGITVVSFVLIAGLACGLAWSVNENMETSRELSSLKEQLRRMPAPVVDAGRNEERTEEIFPAGNSIEAKIFKRFESVEKRLDDQETTSREIVEWKEKVADPVVMKFKDFNPESTSPASAAKPISREELERIVSEKIAKEQENSSFRTKKPSLERFAMVLKLDSDQVDSVKEAVFASQGQVLDLLKIPRADGGSFAEDFVDIFSTGDEAEGGKTLILKLMSTKIPERDETYFLEIVKISMSLKEEFKGIMSEDQFRKYEASSVEPMDVEIKGNPLEVYILEQIKARGGEREEH